MSNKIQEKIFEALGAASVCWSETPTGVFDSNKASEFGNELYSFIMQNTGFFQALAEKGNVDLTIRIMQKEDTFTLNVMPGSTVSTINPMIISGSAADLDRDFLTTLYPEIEKVGCLVSNISEVKQQVEDRLADEKSDADSKEAKKPKESKSNKKVSAKPSIKASGDATQKEEPNLFEND